MSVEEARAKFEAAQEEAYRKRRAFIECKIKANALEREYEKTETQIRELEQQGKDTRPAEDTRGRLTSDWYNTERELGILRHEAKQADDEEEKAGCGYRQGRRIGIDHLSVRKPICEFTGNGFFPVFGRVALNLRRITKWQLNSLARKQIRPQVLVWH